MIDLVAGQFDAGIHVGEFIHRDMIAVKVTEDRRLAVVGSPAYFESRKVPKSTGDLKDHACIALRLRKSGVYRWEFLKGRRSLTVSPRGPLTFSDAEFALEATLEGLGLMMTMEAQVEEHAAKGDLVSVLRDGCPGFPGYFFTIQVAAISRRLSSPSSTLSGFR